MRLSHDAQRRALSGRRAGNVIVFVAVTLTVLLGVVGIVIDGGRVVAERRHAQNACDAAAMAAAIELYKGSDSTTARDLALTYASRNGLNNDGATNTVTVNIPPASGPYAGDLKFAEVLSTRKLTTYFIQFVTPKAAQPQVRSVAGYGKRPPGSPAVVVLDPKSKDAFIARKRLDLTVQNGPIHVNSSDAKQAAVAKDGATVTATEIKVHGGYTEKSKGDFSPNPSTGVDPLNDPLAMLNPPNKSDLPNRPKVDVHDKSVTLLPGVYTGGIKIKGHSDVYMYPGIYYINGGGMEINISGDMYGDGVMIFNSGSKTDGSTHFDKVHIKVGGVAQLSAPTSGDFEGLSIFNDRGNTKEVKIDSKAIDQTITGTIYAPNAKVHIHGKGQFDGSQIIAAKCRFCGDDTMTLKYDPSKTAKPTFLSLVE